MNGTRCAIRPEMNVTSRERRSSFATHHRGLHRQRLAQQRAALKRIAALARLHLDQLGNDFEALGFGEAGDGGLLRRCAEAGLATMISSCRCNDTSTFGPILWSEIRKECANTTFRE
jgi:hypothetical protein